MIVLDDLWNEDYGDWNCLRIPFWGGAKGSKIIVTTRSKGVATMMGGEKNLYELKHLSYEDCWLVFEKHAFENRNISLHPSLVLIGKKIVEKCAGLPLAAKTLGGLLRSKHEEKEWKVILNSKIWNLQGEKCGGIIPALRLSYNHLPSNLKRCFAYCAIFPKNYEFMEKELILLWMAEGLIQCSPDDDKREMEDLGHDYFHKLLSMSFFQPSGRNMSRFIMHDFIHDLAQFIAGEICFHLEDESRIDLQYSISEKTRHSSFIRSHLDVFYKFEFFRNVGHLRTFLALPICSSPFLPHYLSNKVLHELVLRQKTLRVLSLSGYSISEIPDSIGDLKHLRYLNLSNTKIKWLPESICDLYYLQTLILSGCKNLTRLPITIGNLINLRHLDISDTCRLEEMPIQIAKIKCLQVLSNVIVGKAKTLEIKELRNLPHLQGDFCISNLENVMNIQDAKYADLNSKHKLEQLTMKWSAKHDDSRNGMHEMDVLNSLQPHSNLKKLNIMEYGGLKFPSWIGNSLFCKMVDVTLINCRKCTLLPCLGQYLPLLKNLWIEGMDEVKNVGIEFTGGPSLSIKAFPSLESLSFVNMPKWVNWEHNSVLDSYPRLQQLTIRNCPQLIQTLPTPLSSLVKFSIWKCPQMGIPFPSLPSLRELDLQECNDMVVRSRTDLISLTHLTISGISSVNRLHEGLVAFLPALEILRISECGELTCLWEDRFGSESFDHLHRLEIRDCPRLVSLGNYEQQGLLPLSLQYLEIWKCDNMEKLPNGLQNLTSLGELNIWGCAKLESFPDMNFPPVLRRLIIRDCEGLKSLPDGMMRNCMLEYLEINFCPSLRCFPEGELPTTLKELHICYCENLESLPDGLMMKDDSSRQQNTSSLQVMQIWRCSSLKSFPRGSFPPTLHLLQIWNCRQLESMMEKMFDSDNSLECLEINVNSNLKSLPDCLYNLKRLQIKRCMNLKSLPHQMRSLTSLTFLEIADCGSIKTPLSKWGLSRLTSLKSFTFAGMFPEATTFSDDDSDDQFLLPSTVTYLSIERFKNLESLASLALQTLTSLQHLWISGCPKLQSFLPREGLIAATVSQLYIRDCPLLNQRCLKEKGEDWPKISHIPYVEIDRKFIFEQ